MSMNKQNALFVNRLIAWSLPLILGGLVPSAAAAPASASGSTAFMQHYRQGIERAENEDWEGAIAEFQRAYEARATPKPELHLYIARAHLRLANGAPALDYYQRFLREAKSPKPEQLKDVTAGIIRAKELMELQAQRERLAAQESAMKAQLQAERSKPAEPSVAVRAPESEPAAQKVSVVARNGQTAYTVAVGPDSMCTAPCQAQVAAGEQTVTVMGPGSKRFQRSLLFPSGPSRLVVQHFTLSRAIAGPILLALSAPFLAGGVMTLSGGSHGANAEAISGASLLFLHGGVFFFTGIGQLAAIKRSSITLEPVGAGIPSHAAGPRLTGAGLLPLADRRGALASVSFRF